MAASAFGHFFFDLHIIDYDSLNTSVVTSEEALSIKNRYSCEWIGKTEVNETHQNGSLKDSSVDYQNLSSSISGVVVKNSPYNIIFSIFALKFASLVI